MTDRTALATQFLQDAGWSDARRVHLAGDASNRIYQRLFKENGQTAVLMDAPPDTGENIRPFIRITQHLRGLNLSAPEILAHDEAHGFLLIEDFGDGLFARLSQKSPDMERSLYSAAVDVLIQLHQHPAPDYLPDYTPTKMADYIAPLFEWYCPAHTDGDEIIATLNEALTPHQTSPIMGLRDYHAENLLWLPARKGTAQVGLLDYQDAVKTHPAYDLISLLTDARRDISSELRGAMLEKYISKTAANPKQFLAACSAISLQRNLRIIGIFARLAAARGKPEYIDLIPRVWTHIQRDLCHPTLVKLRPMLQNTLPEPNHETLQRLKSQCPKPQMP